VLAERRDPLLDRLTVRERPGKWCFRFWQEGTGFDRNLFGRRAILASLNDIHQNLVKRGLCERAIDWKWSSARMHLLTHQSEGKPAYLKSKRFPWTSEIEQVKQTLAKPVAPEAPMTVPPPPP